jgi:hypothetical protein
MRLSLRALVCLVVALALATGAAYGACGKKDTTEGTLTSVDAATKTVVVKAADGKEVKLTMTATTAVKDAGGKSAEASALVGKSVKVVSEHAKIDSITQVA